jgi:hypothetical protein
MCVLGCFQAFSFPFVIDAKRGASCSSVLGSEGCAFEVVAVREWCSIDIMIIEPRIGEKYILAFRVLSLLFDVSPKRGRLGREAPVIVELCGTVNVLGNWSRYILKRLTAVVGRSRIHV